ncbi:MAG: hypothetical protein ACRDNG_04650 [Gaiellaceae bacterium]
MPRHRKSLVELVRDGTFLARKDEHLLIGRTALPWPKLERLRRRAIAADSIGLRVLALELERAVRRPGGAEPYLADGPDPERTIAEVETPHGEELSGISEAADLLGVTRYVVSYRRSRTPRRGDELPPFPLPIAELACGPIWRKADLLAYRCEAERRSRMTWFERWDEDLEAESAVRVRATA